MVKSANASRRPAPGERTRSARPRRDRDDDPAHRRSWAYWILTRFILPVVLLAVIGVGVLYVRLLNGPISLKFMAQPIARSIGSDLPGIAVSIEDAQALMTEHGGIEIRLANIRFADHDGASIARAPLAAVRLNMNALWQGRIAAQRVVLIEPRLLLLYSREQGLALSFSRGDGAPAPVAARAASQPAPAQSPSQSQGQSAAGSRSIDIARAIADTLGQARQQQGGSTAFLKGVGLRNATLIFDNAGQQAVLRISEAEFGLNHNRQGSVLGGDVQFASTRGTWRTTFLAQSVANADQIALEVNVLDLVPRTLSEAMPELDGLAALDLPMNGKIGVIIAPNGTVTEASVGVDLQRGTVATSLQEGGSITVDSGRLDLKYAREARRLELAPSRIVSGRSHVTLAGAVRLPPEGSQTWAFEVGAVDGSIAVDEFGVGAHRIEQLRVRGAYDAGSSTIELAEARIKLAGGEAAFSGRVPLSGSSARMAITGRFSPMSVAAAKAIWPPLVSPTARRWFGTKVLSGRLQAGTISVDSYSLADRARVPYLPPFRAQLAVEGSDIRLQPRPGFAIVEVPRIALRLDGIALEAAANEASIVTSPQRRLAVRGARLVSTDVLAPFATGDLNFRVQGPLPAALELADMQAQRNGRSLSLPGEGIDGRVDGQMKLILPFGDMLGPDEIKLETKGRVTDAKARNVLGGLDVNGATIALDLTDQLLDAKGDLLLGGVAAKLAVQRIFGAADEDQPPIRLRANLDNADRNQLGLDLSDVLQGDLPVELTVATRRAADPVVQLRADLTNSELLIEGLAWRKPPGRSATLQFDIVKVSKTRTELQNFKVVGDDIALGGTLVLDGNNKLREFSFPDLSLNVVSRLEAQGTLRNDNVWAVKVRGATFDGRDFFQSLFSVGQLRDKPLPLRKDQSGLDLNAELDNVLGQQDLTLKGLKLQMSRRAGRLVGLIARGTVDGSGREAGRVLEVGLQQTSNEPRRLVARSDDAGQVFRLIGFYPNMQGGRMRLEVNLDGSGPAEKTGLLAVESFAILGDPVEVGGSANETPIGQRPQRRAAERPMERPVLPFDSMRAPFSVGHGQFVLEDADLRGPVLGVVLKGKADFRARTVDLGGTYVPLQGLNSAVGYFPILGQILAGPRGEGVLGVTFAIQGPMARPQVLVNPVSGILPGILREMMQMTNPTPRVTPREDPRAPAVQAKPKAAVRSFSDQPVEKSEKAKTTQPARPRVDSDGGWSSQTLPAGK